MSSVKVEIASIAKTKKKSSQIAAKLKKTKFPCNQCSKQLTTAAHLKKHLGTHQPKDYTCDNCGRHFNTKDKLRLHLFNHRQYYRVKCTVCEREYKTNQSMRKHLRTHFEQHQCHECGQTYKHKRLLINHISACHQDEPTIPCNYCTRLFPSTTTRDSHQKTIHKDLQVNTKHFKCTECPQGFEMKEELRIHSFIHFDGEIHTCTECHQIFKKKKLLVYHMSKHDSPTFRCDQCQKLFKYRSNLGKHQREGRCKPLEELQPTQSAQEEAVLAKRQFIAMTVNQSKLNINLKDSVKVEKDEEHLIEENFIKEEETLKIERVEDVEDDPFDPESEKVDCVVKSNVKAEEKEIFVEKKLKRAYRKKKPMKIMKKSSTPYECDSCEFTCDKKCQILSHIRFHVASVRHKCKNCTETFSTRLKLHHHSIKVHGRGIIGSVEYSTKAAECPICHQMFSEERLKYHIRLHEAGTFKCSECKKEFRSQAAAEKHLANSHGNEKRFTCSLCGKSFSKLTILKQHEEIHNPIKIYVQCEICNTMMQVKSLKLHMDIKHSDRYKEKRHVCECGKAFRYEKQLQKHTDSVHQKVSRGIVYPCPDCDLAFNRRLELREHSFTHYTGKIFECECGMKFKKRKLLTLHEAVHKNNRWPCDFCTLTFQTRGGRRKHQSKVHGQVVEEVLEIPSFEAAVCNAVIEEVKA